MWKEGQARGFSNSITDVFDRYEEERDNNCLFRVLSHSTFRFSDFLKEIWGLVKYYTIVNSERFSVRLNDFEEYLILFLDYQA